jgi:hypothetical protein
MAQKARGLRFRLPPAGWLALGRYWPSFDELVVAAGLQKETASQRFTPHSLRRTFASWLAIAGVVCGAFKSITTTERYSHLGQNGQEPYYFELAQCVSNGFVPRFVTSAPENALRNGSELTEVVEDKWWRRGDSNARPRDYETLALAS